MTPSTSLPIGKISSPRVVGAVRRERPLALLDEAAATPLVWITAPGGSGKTTLAAQWLAERKRRHLWYQLDAGDADPATFFYYLSRAASAAFPRRKQALPLLTPEYAQAVPTFIRRCFEALCARLPRNGLVLVLDNYQEVPEEAPLHELLTHGIEVLPPGATLLVLSRSEPPPVFMRLRANGRMAIIGWNDLRFTLDDVRATAGGLGLDDNGLKALHARTDGWAAGLRLAIEALGKKPRAGKGPRDIQATVATHTWREDAFAYFAGEVMSRIDASLHDFLLLTAFPPFVTPALAAALSGQERAGAILNDLSRRNFFTERYPGSEPIYYYHPLFREFLRWCAEEAFGPEKTERLRHRSAELLEEAGFLEEAAVLYCALREFERTMPLIGDIAGPLLAQGRGKAVAELLAALPETLLSTDANLLRIAGLCRLAADPGQARKFLEASFRLMREKGDLAAAVAVCGTRIEAILYQGNEFTAIDSCADWLDRIAEGAELPVRNALKKISGAVLFALVCRSPAHHTLPRWLARAEEALTDTTDAMESLKLCNHLMAYYSFRGEFCSVTRVMKIATQWKKEARRVPLLEMFCLLLDTFCAVFVQGAWAEGIALAQKGLERGKETGVRVYDSWLSYLMISGSILAGNVEIAESFLREIFRGGENAPLKKLAEQQELAGNLAFSKGEWNESAEHFRAAFDLNLRIGARFSAVWSRICLAQTHYCRGETDAARKTLAEAAEEQWAGSHLFCYRGMSTSALIDLGEGAEERGREALREALALARKNDMPLLPFWNRELSATLLAHALDAGIEAEFACDLVIRYRLAPPDSGSIAAAWPWPLKINTLGGFSIRQYDRPLDLGGWQNKPLELLKALIALGGRDVPEERILDALWPDADGDAARASLKTILRRLRQSLGDEGFVLLKNGRLSLSESDCWVDALAFLTDVGNDGTKAKGALSLYQGPFLPDDEAQGWSVTMRERTRRQFLRLLDTLAESLMATGRLADAAARYEQAVEIDDLDEDHYQRLMQCYGRMNRRDKVAQVYQRYCVALSCRLGIEPSPQLQRLHQTLLAGKPS